jgi:cytochrome c
MSSAKIFAVAVAALTLSGVAVAADQTALATKSGCLACHAVDHKILGPAYKDVATKYAGDKTAAAKLYEKVEKGGGGVWGQIPMPPNAAVSKADIKTLVDWILSLK